MASAFVTLFEGTCTANQQKFIYFQNLNEKADKYASLDNSTAIVFRLKQAWSLMKLKAVRSILGQKVIQIDYYKYGVYNANMQTDGTFNNCYIVNWGEWEFKFSFFR